MSRGTWQGSGTWQTSGPDFTGLLVPVVLIGAAAGVAMFVLEFIWYIVAALAVFTVAFAAAFIWAVRTRPTRTAEPGRRGIALVGYTPLPEAKPEVTPGTAPAIENHYHVHHHYADSRERPGIPVIPGRVIGSKEE